MKKIIKYIIRKFKSYLNSQELDNNLNLDISEVVKEFNHQYECNYSLKCLSHKIINRLKYHKEGALKTRNEKKHIEKALIIIGFISTIVLAIPKVDVASYQMSMVLISVLLLLISNLELNLRTITNPRKTRLNNEYLCKIEEIEYYFVSKLNNIQTTGYDDSKYAELLAEMHEIMKQIARFWDSFDEKG